MVSSFSALLYVNYPTQVLAKSCKMIPVLLMATIFKMKLYPLRKYINVFAISVGISFFMLYGDNSSKHSKNNPNESTFGYFLLFLSLLSDGFTNAIQDDMRHSENKPSSDEMMLYTNLFAIPFLTIILIYSGETNDALNFCLTYKSIMFDLFMFCVCMSVGQIFIFMCISRLGNLFLNLITTSRKFFTILFSVLYFGHSLTQIQWISVFVVFVALIIDVFDH